MKVHELFEEKEDDKPVLPVDTISIALFKKKAGLIKNKQDPDKPFIGVEHEKSTVKGLNGKHLMLTFDNSTESGEFEINSLSSLKIVKGSEVEREIRKLFLKHEVETKKKIAYIVSGDESVVRSIFLGKKLGKPAVRLVSELLRIFKKLIGDDSEEHVEDDEQDLGKEEVQKKDKDVKKNSEKPSAPEKKPTDKKPTDKLPVDKPPKEDPDKKEKDNV